MASNSANFDLMAESSAATVAKIPRPPNAWILFRAVKQNQIVEKNGKKPRAEISKLVSQMWKDVSPDEKAQYEALAAHKSAEHNEKHPGFIFRPVKKGGKKSKKGSKQSKQKRNRKKAEHSGDDSRMPEFVSPVEPRQDNDRDSDVNQHHAPADMVYQNFVSPGIKIENPIEIVDMFQVTFNYKSDTLSGQNVFEATVLQDTGLFSGHNVLDVDLQPYVTDLSSPITLSTYDNIMPLCDNYLEEYANFLGDPYSFARRRLDCGFTTLK